MWTTWTNSSYCSFDQNANTQQLHCLYFASFDILQVHRKILLLTYAHQVKVMCKTDQNIPYKWHNALVCFSLNIIMQHTPPPPSPTPPAHPHTHTHKLTLTCADTHINKTHKHTCKNTTFRCQQLGLKLCKVRNIVSKKQVVGVRRPLIVVKHAHFEVTCCAPQLVTGSATIPIAWKRASPISLSSTVRNIHLQKGRCSWWKLT